MQQEKIREFYVVEGPFSGTYGSVRGLCHSLLGFRRALKELHPHVKPEIIREEALKQATIRSPYVVQIYDFWESENAILMEYCPVGLDFYLLKRIGQVDGRIPYDEARDLLYGVLQGLNDAHAAGVIHGDIKPANVRFGGGERKDDLGLPKLTDFGAARRVRETAPGIRGSSNWMAPEVIRGGTPTEEADYFSFGILAYLVLSGRHPFFADNPSCLLNEEDNITDATFLPPSLAILRPDMPARVADLVMELLSRDTSSRISAEKELKAALAQPLESTPEPPHVTPPSPDQPSPGELTGLREAYDRARELFFVYYRPWEAIQVVDAVLDEFEWQRFSGSKVTPLADCWSLKAFISNSSGRWGEAVECATNGLTVHPDHVNSLHARAYGNTQLGNYPEALTDLKSALTLATTPLKRRQLNRLLDTVQDRQPRAGHADASCQPVES